MERVHVNLGERSYDIHIGRGLPVGECLADRPETRVLVVTDSNVGPLHAERVRNELAGRGLIPSVVTVPAGEASKSVRSLERLYAEAIRAGLDRTSAVVALGGGVVGDLAGFAAATLYRGIRLIQVPTSLLAMVDSSVGGKTAVNLPQGKNLVGAFYQPVEVVVDLDTLATLPEREYVSGLAEVVKYGIIWDAAFFRDLEAQGDALRSRRPDSLGGIVGRCCEVKAEVVALDERESGMRAVLNFGHTLAHALEQGAGYGAWLHGEAVAVGIEYAMQLSVRERGLAEEAAARVRRLLESLGLPTAPDARAPAPAWEDIRAGMATDKKNRGGVPRFVLAEQVGNVVFGCDVAEPTLRDVYRRVNGG